MMTMWTIRFWRAPGSLRRVVWVGGIIACWLAALATVRGQGLPFEAFHEIRLARSADGLRWTPDPAEAPLRVAATMPGVLYRETSGALIYALSTTPDAPPALIVLRSEAPFESWTEHPVTLDLGADVDKVPFLREPRPVLLADGRIRLYLRGDPAADRSTVYSAISADSETFDQFTLERGERLALEGLGQITGAAQSGENWLMGITTGRTTAFYRSADGLAFEPTGAFELGLLPNLVALEDGAGLRAYFNGSPAFGDPIRFGLLMIAESSDGQSWKIVVDQLDFLGGAPGVTHLPDGTWLMAYVTISADAPGLPPGISAPGGN